MSRVPNDFALSNLSRRGFLKGVGATGALVLAASWGWQDALADDKETVWRRWHAQWLDR
jgi:isoquinoline 1-oxidoreductase beta subunit